MSLRVFFERHIEIDANEDALALEIDIAYRDIRHIRLSNGEFTTPERTGGFAA
jgi:hypothetical protein